VGSVRGQSDHTYRSQPVEVGGTAAIPQCYCSPESRHRLPPIRPFLKWAGGKRILVSNILPLIPNSFRRYYEPFLGGGALFFALQPENALLSDNNHELINCYLQVRDHCEKVVARLKLLRNQERDYYRIRGRVPGDEIGRAARLIYLTTLSFNGIHRLNQRGEFNVPYGYKLHIEPCDTQKLRRASAALATARLEWKDFEPVVSSADEGDVVYLDPPYTVSHGNNGFLKYNAKIFSWNDQLRLSNVARSLASRGCKVIVSNADHPSILRLYRGFAVLKVSRPSVIAASGGFRRQITEYIFYNEG